VQPHLPDLLQRVIPARTGTHRTLEHIEFMIDKVVANEGQPDIIQISAASRPSIPNSGKSSTPPSEDPSSTSCIASAGERFIMAILMAVGVQHEVLDGSSLGGVEDLPELGMDGRLAAGDLMISGWPSLATTLSIMNSMCSRVRWVPVRAGDDSL